MKTPTYSGALTEKYLFPPFSVLNTRSKEWKDRYKKWMSLGFRDDLGRATPSFTGDYGLHTGKTWNRIQIADPHFYLKKTKQEEISGKKLSDEEFIDSFYTAPESVVSSGSSSFDPVLAELLCLWFSAEGSQVIDPFSGGPTRGIVSGKLNRRYFGVDLLADQVAFNRDQLGKLETLPGVVEWSHGDSSRALIDFEVPEADYLYTCPPYYRLERYSDDLRDLSNTSQFHSYLYGLVKILARYLTQLKNDRFFSIVLTDVRNADGAGGYLSLPYKVVCELEKLKDVIFYNDFVLVNNSASLPLRTGRIFNATRKYGRSHQNVLVFCKGDPRKATAYCREGELTRW